jgi:hypothetical protein
MPDLKVKCKTAGVGKVKAGGPTKEELERMKQENQWDMEEIQEAYDRALDLMKKKAWKH